MSKLQLLYEKLMKFAYIFAAIFFVLFLIDLFAAIATNSFDCSTSAICQIKEEQLFFKLTLYPLGIGTLVFILSGYIFFTQVHKEADLLSVSDYKKSLAEDSTSEEETMSRDDLYEKLRRKREDHETIFTKAGNAIKSFFASIGNFFKNIANKTKRNLDASKQKREVKRHQKEEIKVIEKTHKKEVEAQKARTKLNKTALIILISEATKLTQNDSRKFLNTFLDTIKETVIKEEEVKLSKFGKFEKVHIEAHHEIDEETGNKINIIDHNTVEFTPFKALLERFGNVIEDSPEEEVQQVEEVLKEETPVQETPVEEPVQEIEETVAEEVQQAEKVLEEETPVQEPPIEEPVQEIEETVAEEVQQVEKVLEEETPVKVTEDDKEEEPVIETIKSDKENVEIAVEEPVEDKTTEPTTEDSKTVVTTPKPDPETIVQNQVTEKPKKPSKPKVVTKTKTDIINLLDATTDLSKNKSNKFLKFFAQVVKEELAKRQDIELPGIGLFTTIEMPAKEAVNPQTNQKIIVPAHYQVRLRFEDELKDKMNEEK